MGRRQLAEGGVLSDGIGLRCNIKPEVRNEILREKDENTEDKGCDQEVTCNFCKKQGPTKRCAKRHPKCIKKLFCNEVCEMMAHKKKEDPNAPPKAEVKKVDKKKSKAKKKENVHG